MKITPDYEFQKLFYFLHFKKSRDIRIILASVGGSVFNEVI